MSPERRAWTIVWGHKGFLLLQTVGVALWAAVAVGWFWLPDSKTWGVLLSAVGAIPVMAGFAWLIGAAFVFYRKAYGGEPVRLPAACRQALRRSPALIVWTIALAVALWLALRAAAPRWIWILVPLLLLPVAAQVTAEGARGWIRPPWRPRYFLQFAALAIPGILAPYALIAWHPAMPGLALQTASLALRFLVAYQLAITAWLILASLLAAAPARASREP